MSRDLGSLLEAIKTSKNIAIISHKMPDADAFSSSMALREIIKKLQTTEPGERKSRKRTDVFLDTEALPSSLKIFIPQNGNFTKYFNPQVHPQKYDLVIALDCASEDRMGKNVEIFKNGVKRMQIDHHATNTIFAEENFIMKTSSTCEALFYLFIYKKPEFQSTKYINSLLFAGVITDTNNLKTNADSLATEKCISYIKQNLGAGLTARLRANFFENNSPAKDILNAYAYSKKNRKYLADEKLCVITLNNQAFTEANAEMDDAEGIVDEALYRRGVLISAIILEKNKGELYVKLRGKDGIDVSALATKFGGGGHTNQAAFQFKGEIKDLMPQFLQEAKQLAETSKENGLENYQELFEN